MDIISNIVDFISYQIDRENLPTYEFAEKIGMDNASLSQWLNYKYPPNVINLTKLADYYGVSIDFILGFSDDGRYYKSELNESFADRLELLCRAKGISYYRLSKECGVGNSAVSKWLKRGQLPRIETLAKIAQVLDCSVDYLIGRSDIN